MTSVGMQMLFSCHLIATVVQAEVCICHVPSLLTILLVKSLIPHQIETLPEIFLNMVGCGGGGGGGGGDSALRNNLILISWSSWLCY